MFKTSFFPPRIILNAKQKKEGLFSLSLSLHLRCKANHVARSWRERENPHRLYFFFSVLYFLCNFRPLPSYAEKLFSSWLFVEGWGASKKVKYILECWLQNVLSTIDARRRYEGVRGIKTGPSKEIFQKIW